MRVKLREKPKVTGRDAQRFIKKTNNNNKFIRQHTLRKTEEYLQNLEDANYESDKSRGTYSKIY
ncbi:hypothetical protein [Halobacillus sp. K22]|uniref:hypothetical protein n=1 Tax=Halobacillus sp. K22 TaxID=3457431 RepID=UPI003FCC3EA6